MNWWQALILGLVQGLGEFLPISSSGHLVLTREILGISGEYMLFDMLLHVGTVCAIFVVFFKDLIALFKPPFKTIGYILLASVPAIIVGLLFNSHLESFFSGAKYLCFFFLFTAVLMLTTEILGKRLYKEPKPFTWITAVSMGLMQGIAVFPGISRSGSTLFGGTVAGGKREEIAKFSFFMSIPVILGGAVLQLFGLEGGLSVDWWCILIGMISSFLSGLLAVKLMMRLIAKADYKWFALYLLVVSVLTFVFFFIGV